MSRRKAGETGLVHGYWLASTPRVPNRLLFARLVPHAQCPQRVGASTPMVAEKEMREEESCHPNQPDAFRMSLWRGSTYPTSSLWRGRGLRRFLMVDSHTNR